MVVIFDSIAANEAQNATNEFSDSNNKTIELTRPRNNHAEIKALINHIADGLSKRFDTIDAVLLNELSMINNRISTIERSLQHLTDNFESIETMSRQIDELADHRNAIDIDLAQLKSTQDVNQMINSKLIDLQQTVDYLKSHLETIEQQYPYGRKYDSFERNNQNNIRRMNGNADDDTSNAANCESKIDELISFVHNFGEINRLESSDILTRLSNMQTQLIHFFDAYKGSSKIQSVSREQTIRNRTIEENFDQRNNVSYTENDFHNNSNKTDVKHNDIDGDNSSSNGNNNNVNDDNNIALNLVFSFSFFPF